MVPKRAERQRTRVRDCKGSLAGVDALVMIHRAEGREGEGGVTESVSSRRGGCCGLTRGSRCDLWVGRKLDLGAQVSVWHTAWTHCSWSPTPT